MQSLGIDPGTATVGYGIVRALSDGSLQAVDYGAIVTSPALPTWERLSLIYDSVCALIDRHQPDRAAVEELLFGKNVTTAISVAQGRGVVLLALAQKRIQVREYKPNFVKQSVSGYGNAKKPQMQEMVRMLLTLEDIPKPDDAADALAVAIADLHSAHFSSLLDEN
jgi:crossover junction endodeoxyribonuclease RuvC